LTIQEARSLKLRFGIETIKDFSETYLRYLHGDEDNDESSEEDGVKEE